MRLHANHAQLHQYVSSAKHLTICLALFNALTASQIAYPAKAPLTVSNAKQDISSTVIKYLIQVFAALHVETIVENAVRKLNNAQNVWKAINLSAVIVSRVLKGYALVKFLRRLKYSILQV